MSQPPASFHPPPDFNFNAIPDDIASQIPPPNKTSSHDSARSASLPPGPHRHADREGASDSLHHHNNALNPSSSAPAILNVQHSNVVIIPDSDANGTVDANTPLPSMEGDVKEEDEFYPIRGATPRPDDDFAGKGMSSQSDGGSGGGNQQMKDLRQMSPSPGPRSRAGSQLPIANKRVVSLRNEAMGGRPRGEKRARFEGEDGGDDADGDVGAGSGMRGDDTRARMARELRKSSTPARDAGSKNPAQQQEGSELGNGMAGPTKTVVVSTKSGEVGNVMATMRGQGSSQLSDPFNMANEAVMEYQQRRRASTGAGTGDFYSNTGVDTTFGQERALMSAPPDHLSTYPKVWNWPGYNPHEPYNPNWIPGLGPPIEGSQTLATLNKGTTLSLPPPTINPNTALIPASHPPHSIQPSAPSPIEPVKTDPSPPSPPRITTHDLLPLPPLSPSALLARFDASMSNFHAQEQRLLDDYEAWRKIFGVWAATSRVNDERRGAKRLRTRLKWVGMEEEEVERQRVRMGQVVEAFERALEMMGE